jgi:hypothetical protein
LQTLSEVPSAKWREYDAEDTVQVYALRLREAGLSAQARNRSSPTAPIGGS